MCDPFLLQTPQISYSLPLPNSYNSQSCGGFRPPSPPPITPPIPSNETLTTPITPKSKIRGSLPSYSPPPLPLLPPPLDSLNSTPINSMRMRNRGHPISPQILLRLSSVRDHTMDILSVIGALLFGVGCGAITVAVMYALWALFSSHVVDFDETSSSSDDDDDCDDDVIAAKKLGYVAVPKAVDDDLKKPAEGAV